jgi:hypothetical protein
VRVVTGGETLRNVEDSTLAQVISAANQAGYWIFAVDDSWRWVYVSNDIGGLSDGAANGAFFYSADALASRLGDAGVDIIEVARREPRQWRGWLVSDVSGGRDAVRELVHPELRDVVDDLEPCNDAALGYETPRTLFGHRIGFSTLAMRVRDTAGRIVGTVFLDKPAVPMSTIWLLTATGDLDHFDRIQQLAKAGRRPGAVFFADLERSAPLARRLSTGSYFALIRRLTYAADRAVVENGGIVGRHAGDGVTAFFVAETARSESAAARACISAARALRTATETIAARHDLPAEDRVCCTVR